MHKLSGNNITVITGMLIVALTIIGGMAVYRHFEYEHFHSENIHLRNEVNGLKSSCK